MRWPLRGHLAMRVASVGLGLVAAWGLTYVSGGSRTAAPHLFYLPVVLAALWFRPEVASAWAVIIGLAAGPLMPLNTSTGAAQSLVNWVGRLGAFVAIALLISLIQQRQARLVARDLEVAEKERDLDAQRAAVLQIISHEIRTPVTVLGGSMELIAAGRSLAREGDLIESMRRSLARLEDLATLVSATVERETRDLPVMEVSTSELIEATVGELPRTYDHSRLSLDCIDERCLLPAPDNVRLATRLLIENALRFSDDEIEVHSRIHRRQLAIRIADRGPGIPAELAAGSKPFEQGDASMTRRHGGLGLGLYAARQLISQLDGQLQVRPRTPRGTQLLITVPIRARGGCEHR